MIEIVQAGQSGKTRLLFDMHRLRSRIFKERMGWNVSIDEAGLEVDDFDIPEAVYFLALDDNQRVIGSWRLLPTTGPTMIRDVWPEFLTSLPMPRSPMIWEASRFGVNSLSASVREGLHQVSRATAELFCALTETCILCGIDEVYTLYDARIARLIKRLDCTPKDISESMPIDGRECKIGRFITDSEMLSRIKKSAGIQKSLVTEASLPPILTELRNVVGRTQETPQEFCHAI